MSVMQDDAPATVQVGLAPCTPTRCAVQAEGNSPGLMVASAHKPSLVIRAGIGVPALWMRRSLLCIATTKGRRRIGANEVKMCDARGKVIGPAGL